MRADRAANRRRSVVWGGSQHGADFLTSSADLLCACVSADRLSLDHTCIRAVGSPVAAWGEPRPILGGQGSSLPVTGGLSLRERKAQGCLLAEWVPARTVER